MTTEAREINQKGIEAMQSQDWELASRIFIRSLARQEKQAHVHYMLGQCYRFTERYSLSIEELIRATELDDTCKEWFLALGIAFQLNGNFEESLDALRKANMLDQDYELAYNSAAVTFRKMGKFRRAAEVYDLGIKAFIRKFLCSAQNARDQEANRFFETGTHLYVSYTIKALMHHAALSGVSKVTFPSAEFATSDHPNSDYGGLLWFDDQDENGTNRLYLANCFDTVRTMLASSQFYCMSLENKSRALNELGEEEEANECLNEANAFRRIYELRKSST